MNRSHALLFLVLVTTPVAADWSQLMRDSTHTGNAPVNHCGCHWDWLLSSHSRTPS